MLKEATALHEAAGDAVEALAHLGLLAAIQGHVAFAEVAQEAMRTLLGSPDAGRVVPAEYLQPDEQ